jgi:sugar/nucleoside kinase (ribokinase family)
MHDFVAIGDTVTDAFIKLKNAQVTCDVNKVRCTITMAFGDKIPYESVEEVVSVGNSANASVAAARLGLKAALVTNLGEDEHGRRALENLRKEKVADDFITLQPGKKTNYHYVLWYGDDRTILVKHEEFSYKLPEIGSPKWLYLSSLGANTLPYHHAIASYLEDHPAVKLAFQPGTFQINSIADMGSLMKHSEIFFCNMDEAARILKTSAQESEKLLKGLHALGPKTVVITDGPKGAYAYDGQNFYKQLAYPDPKPPFERTGAGDAFASTTVAALALGKDLKEALAWAAVNSMSVVQQVGAQKGLLSREEIERFLIKS